MNIWSITAGSKVSSTLASYMANCVDRRRVIHKCRSTTHEWSGVCHKRYCRNAQKCNIFSLICWLVGVQRHFQHKKAISCHIFAYNGLPWGATGHKRGENTSGTHMYHHVPSCKISRRSVPPSNICKQKPDTEIGDSLWGYRRMVYIFRKLPSSWF